MDNPMAYWAYSGPRGSEKISPVVKDRLLYKEFETLDDAFAWRAIPTKAAASRCSSKVTTARALAGGRSPGRSTTPTSCGALSSIMRQRHRISR